MFAHSFGGGMMVDPAINSLLVLYDDAQSIYERARSKQFSFKRVGIQVQGRTTILKINYCNTRQILQTASLIAADLLMPDDKDDDRIPLVKPISCGRDGQAPLIIRLPSLHAEAVKVAELLSAAHQEGHVWGDMAVICRRYDEMGLFEQVRTPVRFDPVGPAGECRFCRGSGQDVRTCRCRTGA